MRFSICLNCGVQTITTPLGVRHRFGMNACFKLLALGELRARPMEQSVEAGNLSETKLSLLRREFLRIQLDELTQLEKEINHGLLGSMRSEVPRPPTGDHPQDHRNPFE